MSYLGKITTTREATCARCEQMALGLGKYPATELKEMGWRQVRGEGWVCPHCLGKKGPTP